MKIFYFVRSLEAVPSCMYNIQIISDLSFETIVATGRSTESMNSVMKSKNINFIDGQAKRVMGGKVQKALNRFRLTAALRKSVKLAMKQYETGDIVFWGTADTALASKQFCKNSINVLSLKELHETPWHYPMRLKKLAPKCAAVICCEKNRARVLQFRWNLQDRPYTISNKPYGYPTERNLAPTSDKTKGIIDQISGGKTLVYQARKIQFAKELINLASALKQLNDDYQLILIGEVDNPADRVKISGIYPKILWTGHIDAPMHLEITSYAKAGVAVYAESSLNNLFCAPNKTYEYASFGIPTICNDVPGLVETIGISRAGVCLDWNNVDSICTGIKALCADYDSYSSNAKMFYNSEDNKEKLNTIISNIIDRRTKK